MLQDEDAAQTANDQDPDGAKAKASTRSTTRGPNQELSAPEHVRCADCHRQLGLSKESKIGCPAKSSCRSAVKSAVTKGKHRP